MNDAQKTEDFERKLWKALKSDRTVMLGLVGVEEGHSHPMTAQTLHGDGERGPIWFFTSKETDLARALGQGSDAIAHFASKGHDLFASLHGELVPESDHTLIDKLWSPFVAAWFEGKNDPKLLLLRLDAERAQVWLNENSLWAGVKLLMGRDPKKEYAGKTAELPLRQH
jgi:general stress protein 26